jgi:succinyl-CoA synthetase alpha subunit
MIFVPPPFAADAILEAADAGIRGHRRVTEGVPTADMVRVKSAAHQIPNSCSSGPTARA